MKAAKRLRGLVGVVDVVGEINAGDEGHVLSTMTQVD